MNLPEFYLTDKLIILSGFDTSPLEPSPLLIKSTNSIPLITFPKTVYCRSREGADLKAEFSNIPHERGTLSMARSADPNSANSQFFICFEAAPSLDRQYTVFGKVIKGMEFVDLIKKGEGSNGAVSDPDKIISLAIK